MIPKTTIKFRFGSADTDTGDKHVKQGDLVTATNVRMTAKRGEHAKRPGFVAAQTTFSGGTLGTAVTDLVTVTGGTNLIRDNADQMWAENGGTATYVGRNQRPWPETQTVIPAELTYCRPKICIVGANTWVFTVNDNAASYWLTVVETVSGVTVMAPRLITAAAAAYELCPVYDGVNVWLFYVTNSTTVRLHKFVVATPSVAPTAYTYTTVADTKSSSIDAKYFAATDSIYVVWVGSGAVGLNHTELWAYSHLNRSTGAATSETIRQLTPSNGSYFGCVSILEGQTGAEAYWYFAYNGIRLQGAAGCSLTLVRVSASAWTYTVSDVTTAYPNGPLIASPANETAYVCSGYCQDSSTQVVFSQSWSVATGSTEFKRPDVLPMWKCTFANGAWNNDSTVFKTGAWLASTPWQQGSNWFFLTGYDDGDVPMTEAIRLQRGYHVRNSDGTIVASVDTGQGGGAWGKIATQFTGTIYTSPPRAFVNGTTVALPVVKQNSNINFIAGALLRIDHAKQYGPAINFMGGALVPGPIPMVWNGSDVHEVAPLLFPWLTLATQNDGVPPFAPLATAIAIRYVIVDQYGNQFRGAPTIKVEGMEATTVVTYPTLRHLLPGTTAKVEIYLANTTSTTPKLQVTVANNPLVDTQTYTFPAAVAVGESLDTFGGALGQSWPVPCEAAINWRGRIFLSQGNTLYFSQEMQEGYGPLFNDALTAEWTDAGGTDIRSLGIVNYDYLAAFADGMVGVISGPGPDGLARGNYVFQTVSTRTGTVAPRSVLQGPDGCYFWEKTAQRLCLLTSSLTVKDAEGISREFFGKTDDPCGVWWEQQRSMVWFGASSQLVLDYGNRAESCPLGRMYKWTLTGFASAPALAAVNSGAVAAVDVSGDIYDSNAFDSTYHADTIRTVETPIRRVVRTAWLQPDDLQGEFDVSWIKLIFKHSQDCPITIRLYADYSTTAITETATITTTVQQVAFRPAGCARIQALAIEIEDGTHAAGQTRGAIFEGVAMEIKLRGRSKMLNSGQVL